MEVIKKSTLFYSICIALLFFAGCATFKNAFHPLPPVTYDEIIRLTQDKVAPETIINKIRDSGTVFRLNSNEVMDLRQHNVDQKVVDYMLDTYTEAVRQQQELDDWNRWWFYEGHYYWWPDWDEYYYPHIYNRDWR